MQVGEIHSVRPDVPLSAKDLLAGAIVDQVWYAREPINAMSAVIKILMAAGKDSAGLDALKFGELLALLVSFRDGMTAELDKIEAIANGEEARSKPKKKAKR